MVSTTQRERSDRCGVTVTPHNAPPNTPYRNKTNLWKLIPPAAHPKMVIIRKKAGRVNQLLKNSACDNIFAAATRKVANIYQSMISIASP